MPNQFTNYYIVIKCLSVLTNYLFPLFQVRYELFQFIHAQFLATYLGNVIELVFSYPLRTVYSTLEQKKTENRKKMSKGIFLVFCVAVLFSSGLYQSPFKKVLCRSLFLQKHKRDELLETFRHQRKHLLLSLFKPTKEKEPPDTTIK